MEAVHLDYENRAVCGAKYGYLMPSIEQVTCEACKEWTETNARALAHSASLMTPGACITAIAEALRSLGARMEHVRASMNHPAFEDEEDLEGDAFAEANADMNARLDREYRERHDG